MTTATAPPATWQNRIVGTDTIAPDRLMANPRNWRKHPKHQRAALLGLLDEVGWIQQVIVNRRTGHLVDGHLRVELAASRGEETVPVVLVDLSETEEALALASLDPISTLAAPDRDALSALLEEVSPASADVRQMLADLARDAGLDRAQPGLIGEDELPAESEDLWVAPGDVWRLGDHRLVVGDACDPAVVATATEGAPVDLVWTDPPYGVAVVGKTAEAMTLQNDDLGADDLRLLLERALGNARDALRPGGSIYVAAPGGAQGWVFADVLIRLELFRQTIVWVKDAFVMSRQDLHWRHELVHLGVKPGEGSKVGSPVFVGWRRGAAHFFAPDRTLDTVWEIPRPKASRDHPTMKPVDLVARSISCSSRRGDTVLDLFVGSGTTIIAAQTLGRRCVAVELDPRFAQRAIARWQAFTGLEASRA